MSKDSQNGDSRPAPSFVEWAARAVSALSLLALFGFLIYSATKPHIGPNFKYEIAYDKIEERRNGWAVPINITNRGTVAISEFIYEVRMRSASMSEFDVKRGRVAVFGAGESVATEVWFDRDPRDADFEFRVDAYTL